MPRFSKLEIQVIRQALGAMREDSDPDSLEATATLLGVSTDEVEAAIKSAHHKAAVA